MFDPRTYEDTPAKVTDPFTLESLIAWLEEQVRLGRGDEEYNVGSITHCLLCQFVHGRWSDVLNSSLSDGVTTKEPFLSVAYDPPCTIFRRSVPRQGTGAVMRVDFTTNIGDNAFYVEASVERLDDVIAEAAHEALAEDAA